MAKYVWMDGTTRGEPDPNWDEKKAMELGLIPTPTESPLKIFRTTMRPSPRLEAALNSLGSLRFENEGYTG